MIDESETTIELGKISVAPKQVGKYFWNYLKTHFNGFQWQFGISQVCFQKKEIAIELTNWTLGIIFSKIDKIKWSYVKVNVKDVSQGQVTFHWFV